MTSRSVKKIVMCSILHLVPASSPVLFQSESRLLLNEWINPRTLTASGAICWSTPLHRMVLMICGFCFNLKLCQNTFFTIQRMLYICSNQITTTDDRKSENPEDNSFQPSYSSLGNLKKKTWRQIHENHNKTLLYQHDAINYTKWTIYL